MSAYIASRVLAIAEASVRPTFDPDQIGARYNPEICRPTLDYP